MQGTHLVDYTQWIASYHRQTQRQRPTHDDVTTWKRFPHYWPFVSGVFRLPMHSPHKGQVMGAIMFSFSPLPAHGRLFNKQSSYRWFETPWWSCDMTSGWLAYIHWKVTPWWRHQMETFSALLATCTGNSPAPDEFPAQRPETQIFDVFFDQRLNKRLRKQSWGWWFETLSRPLWRHRNASRIISGLCNIDKAPCQIPCRITVSGFWLFGDYATHQLEARTEHSGQIAHVLTWYHSRGLQILRRLEASRAPFFLTWINLNHSMNEWSHFQ